MEFHLEMKRPGGAGTAGTAFLIHNPSSAAASSQLHSHPANDCVPGVFSSSLIKTEKAFARRRPLHTDSQNIIFFDGCVRAGGLGGKLAPTEA